MKIQKKVLADALRVLGKVCVAASPLDSYRCVRLVGRGSEAVLMAMNGLESIALKVAVEAEGAFDFGFELKVLRDMVRSGSRVLDLQGMSLHWPEIRGVPVNAVEVALPAEFGRLIGSASPIVDRSEIRKVLRGIHLSCEGLTVTDGKQLLHLPMPLAIDNPLNLPLPMALAAAKVHDVGLLQSWYDGDERFFRITIGNLVWQGKALAGVYPNWKQVVPEERSLNCRFSIRDAKSVIEFLKTVPDSKPFFAIEIQVHEHSLTLISMDTPSMSLTVESELIGSIPHKVLAINKHYLLRMLQQGYRTFACSSDCQTPIVASGGDGQYIVMPIRGITATNPVQNAQPITQENHPMAEVKNLETVEPVNSLEELNIAVEELRSKLKTILDESMFLTRKVKEIMLMQQQKEREFVQARRAIERIKMAI